ncbi:MAG: septum formation protein Maf [Lachnospiraceae bacterium]|nr:septum formation protein Maf [Lachnospiraceae bacterium]
MRSLFKYILASGSPRRKEILSRLGFEYKVRVSEVSEEHDDMPPERIVEELSLRKAKAVEESIEGSEGYKASECEDTVIIAADTLVSLDGRVLGKPLDRADSERMIRAISGRAHQVYTGVTLIHLPSGKQSTFSDRTDVHVRELTEAEISAYVGSGEGDDKAGAYAIQGEFGRFITAFEGSRDNVIGFPSEKFCSELNKFKEVTAHE